MFILLAFCQLDAQQAKYVFYFIGDGMGVNQVQGTELYLGELEGKSASPRCNLPSFPMPPWPQLSLQPMGSQIQLRPEQHWLQETKPKTELSES